MDRLLLHGLTISSTQGTGTPGTEVQGTEVRGTGVLGTCRDSGHTLSRGIKAIPGCRRHNLRDNGYTQTRDIRTIPGCHRLRQLLHLGISQSHLNLQEDWLHQPTSATNQDLDQHQPLG